jgi:hypothetical protein
VLLLSSHSACSRWTLVGLTCDFVSAGLHELRLEAVDDVGVCHKAVTRGDGVRDLASALQERITALATGLMRRQADRLSTILQYLNAAGIISYCSAVSNC